MLLLCNNSSNIFSSHLHLTFLHFMFIFNVNKAEAQKSIIQQNVKSTALAEENMSKYRNVDHHRFTSVARQKERLLQHDAFGTGIIGGRSSTKNVFFCRRNLNFDLIVSQHFIPLYIHYYLPTSSSFIHYLIVRVINLQNSDIFSYKSAFQLLVQSRTWLLCTFSYGHWSILQTAAYQSSNIQINTTFESTA